jgi:chorismate lyase/3-hydroxybenzoate synthase
MPDPRVGAIGSDIQSVTSGSLALLSTTLTDAGRLDADALRGNVAHAYDAMGRALRTMGRTAIRWWNYLPDPSALMGPGIDRYMVFNAGRHEGYRRLMGDEPFERSLATASAVGIRGESLVIHCLASREAGRAVENPRQKPAWQYSERYGPVPPSFSRATIAMAGHRQLLLIGGTASVVGEDSMHRGNFRAQLEETFRNLAALLSAARDQQEPAARALARIKEVRVYITREDETAFVRDELRSRCPTASEIELVLARLCRPELLVEIEGVADLGGLGPVRSDC